jgi:DNA-binding Xre family transcriptional regulator
LLYVGIGGCVICRTFLAHSRHSHWFSEIATITVEMREDREAARAAETTAIETEHPKYNVRGTPQMPSVATTNYVSITALKSLRKSRGVSQTQLSKLSGINARSISTYECGRCSRVRPSTAKKLAKALKCRVGTLGRP